MVQLSEVQNQAIDYLDDPCLITAGAGSGKTLTLTHKVENLLHKGYIPEQLLVITFTNKAANELKQRILDKIQIPIQRFQWVRTIHSACLQIIKNHNVQLGYQNTNITIYTPSEQKNMMKKVVAECNLPKKHVKEYLKVMGIFKNSLEIPKKHDFIEDEILINAPTIIQKYDEKILDSNALDFDHILYQVYKFLKDNPEIQEAWKNYFQYIIVDEYQDINPVQHKIISMLTNNNITVVGDDYQSIFSFRGSKPEIFINFNETYPDAKIFKMGQNYRCSKPIVSAANTLIHNNKNQLHKECFSEIDSSNPPVIVKFDDVYSEADSIVKACKKYKEAGIKYEQIAIIYRVKYISRAIEQALVQNGIPYIMIGSVEFFERREIKDLLAYLSLAVNPRDTLSFTRAVSVPRRGVGAKTVEKIITHKPELGIIYRSADLIMSKKINGKNRKLVEEFNTLIYQISTLSPQQALAKVLKDAKYMEYIKAISDTEEEQDDRMDNIKELLSLASQFETIPELLEECILTHNSQEEHEDDDKVNLLTIHSAKGLEYYAVFVVGFEDGTLPHYRSIQEENTTNDSKYIEEERRLAYVAMTRAEKLLNLTCVPFRQQHMPLKPSRFIKEIEGHCAIVKSKDKD